MENFENFRNFDFGPYFRYDFGGECLNCQYEICSGIDYLQNDTIGVDISHVAAELFNFFPAAEVTFLHFFDFESNFRYDIGIFRAPDPHGCVAASNIYKSVYASTSYL